MGHPDSSGWPIFMNSARFLCGPLFHRNFFHHSARVVVHHCQAVAKRIAKKSTAAHRRAKGSFYGCFGTSDANTTVCFAIKRGLEGNAFHFHSCAESIRCAALAIHDDAFAEVCQEVGVLAADAAVRRRYGAVQVNSLLGRFADFDTGDAYAGQDFRGGRCDGVIVFFAGIENEADKEEKQGGCADFHTVWCVS